MGVEWTRHRFSGGVLALDVANTVVHRLRSELRFDRFADQTEIGRFAAAASGFCAEELGGRALDAERSDASVVIELREATDALFRGGAAGYVSAEPGWRGGAFEGSPSIRGAQNATRLPRFLRASAAGLECGWARMLPGQAIPFEAALATSALTLLQPALGARIRVCANCGWLFLDRSRNGSRIWCDMAVCGNRAKARRHYRRSRSEPRETGHAQ